MENVSNVRSAPMNIGGTCLTYAPLRLTTSPEPRRFPFRHGDSELDGFLLRRGGPDCPTSIENTTSTRKERRDNEISEGSARDEERRGNRRVRGGGGSESRWQDGALTLYVFFFLPFFLFFCYFAFRARGRARRRGGRMHFHLFPSVQAENAA